MNVIKYGRWLLAIVLLSIGGVGQASVVSSSRLVQTGSAIVAPSLPLFLDTNETISVTKNGSGADAYWTLTGTGSNTSLFSDLFNSVNLKNESVRYQANFNSAGQLITSTPSLGSSLLTNYLEINGSLPGGLHDGKSSISHPNQLLLKANLIGSASSNKLDTFTGLALGFKAEFTDGWAYDKLGLTGGSSTESLWLLGLSSGFQKLVRALDGDSDNGALSSLFRSSRTITRVASMTSVTAVPVPGAFWLFGTGFIALMVDRRIRADSRLGA